jgi:hypothetical protein
MSLGSPVVQNLQERKEKKRKSIGEIVIQSLFETWARKD